MPSLPYSLPLYLRISLLCQGPGNPCSPSLPLLQKLGQPREARLGEQCGYSEAPAPHQSLSHQVFCCLGDGLLWPGRGLFSS